ncbi:helicase-primase helicase subunit [macacine betaherpesvirus 9]|uniref:Helicase-primase helicase subunit n=1 Tax=macacine betaherpesvirus 9 TaxID=2560568 RepID=A0A191S3S4_9BETA|nr:helicase-primase helicase subunit [macacine betaherpesvirus 9]ANC96525.1 helicase-primase helicase subunit [macacine betaherpesvirus 9]
MSMLSLFPGKYDTKFLLNMSSASKIELIVEKVAALSERCLETPLPEDWYRNILDPELEFNSNFEEIQSIGEEEFAQPLPFLPFTALLITGTAGAGKTSSIQTLAANIDCLITATTSIAAQNLSGILNRTKSAQVKTIFKTFGFNSSHVSMNERCSSSLNESKDIETQQKQDLSVYWNVIADIADRALTFASGKSKDIPDLCESSIIIIDEAGLILRHMLHTVVFFYWFYNGLYQTQLYKKGIIPCIICVGSPTQSGALVSSFNPLTQNKDVKKGFDVLSALICDEILSVYCNISKNWVIFVNNKRCTDVEFGEFLKHIEFGLPLKQELVEYVDRFVRPATYIRNPTNEIGMTRLFLSHFEVKTYFKSLHEQVELTNRDNLFVFPVYFIIQNKAFEDYKNEISNFTLEIEPWFKSNLHRLNTYSQFADQDISKTIQIEEIVLEDGSVEETLITCHLKHIRHSSIGVTSRIKSSTVGFSGTYEKFVELLQSDLFIEKTACEYSVHAYSFLTGLMFGGMYSFFSSEFTTPEVICELKKIKLPDIDFLQTENFVPLQFFDETDEYYDLHVNDPTDEEMLATDPCSDPFFLKYRQIPLANALTFEEISLLYTVFKEIFILRFAILQKFSSDKFGKTNLVTYNRNNVSRKKCGEICSHVKSFYGMLTYAIPANNYTLEGYTYDNVIFLGTEKLIPSIIYKRGLPKIVIKDEMGFISILENNVSKFTDTVNGNHFHICTTVDYAIVSKVAMTVTKSQGLSIQRVALDFGNNPKNLKMSTIYVGMSRVVDPNSLIMNLNPLRFNYENDNIIASHIVKALKNKETMLIF